MSPAGESRHFSHVWQADGRNVECSQVAGPLHEAHGIVYADVDPLMADAAHYTLDAAGHYNRPDIFRSLSAGDEPSLSCSMTSRRRLAK